MENTYPTTVEGLSLVCATLSDVGCRREKNEDAAGFFPGAEGDGTYLLVVADGVGGNVAGEVASNLAVKTIGETFFRQGTPRELGPALRDAIVAASRAILADAERNLLHASMATTCTVAAIRGEELVIGHIGDCRAYLARAGRLELLTEDHSLAAEYERRGESLPPDKRSLANVLTRWLGTASDVDVDISEPIPFHEGSTLVLCSDGLTKTVKDDEILHAVSMHLPGRACRRLVDLARERGGPDNITVQAAKLTRA